MKAPRVFADFHNADTQGRLRLNCMGTAEDLEVEGVAHYSTKKGMGSYD
ncbi:hypothetical protein RIF25_02470 [Thermosynechococcaceae cyanobacterium BACA0444]|uniref:Uncharacterized protein n=1 Tax=Pseudocalidococcus azoricus BACA0444 TaxID=2918990 RepID=A0AAE4JXB3_9CYAN|nr:hypothetical protein [Pseudocalidococcus azoricus]MDS3859664.1 hypothetical protein [Pseudocalidococcus azoricus BACA0444]